MTRLKVAKLARLNAFMETIARGALAARKDDRVSGISTRAAEKNNRLNVSNQKIQGTATKATFGGLPAPRSGADQSFQRNNFENDHIAVALFRTIAEDLNARR